MKKLLFCASSLFLILISNQVLAQDTLPINERIVQYCENHLNKKVDTGECWDLANAALNTVDAKWNPPYNFGTELNLKTEKIKPGDIVQFEKVKFVKANGAWSYFPHHTAIVYKLLDNETIQVVHQNYDGVRKVKTFEFKLENKTEGDLKFYRAVSN